MKIPFYDLKQENIKIKNKLENSFKKNLYESNFILGKNVDLFEKEWVKYIDAKYCIGVGSGTDALIISLMALGIKEGDEVIVPAFTFVATAFAVSLVGAKPVFVDVNPETHSIDTEKIEKAITKKTRALIPVHLYGNVAEMDEINKIAKKYKLFVLEDAAQAHGALYKGEKAGSLGDVAAFSFYPAKNLGALGDGGAIVTNNQKIAEKIKLIRNYGQKKKYYSEIIGYNSRLDDLQAAFLRIKLKQLDQENIKRNKTAKKYKEYLDGIPIRIPSVTNNSISSYHLFTIQSAGRDRVIKRLSTLGVQTLIHYPVPVHLQNAYKDLGYNKGDFPIAEKIAATTISLPFFPSMTDKQIKYVVDSLKKSL